MKTLQGPWRISWQKVKTLRFGSSRVSSLGEKLAGFLNIARREGLVVREVFEQNGVVDRREWIVDRTVGSEKEIFEQGWLLVSVLCQGKGE